MSVIDVDECWDYVTTTEPILRRKTKKMYLTSASYDICFLEVLSFLNKGSKAKVILPQRNPVFMSQRF